MAVGPLQIIIILVIALLVFGGMKDGVDDQSNSSEEALDVTPKNDK